METANQKIRTYREWKNAQTLHRLQPEVSVLRECRCNLPPLTKKLSSIDIDCPIIPPPGSFASSHHCSQLQMFSGIIAIMGFRCHWTHLQLQRWNGPCNYIRIYHCIQLPIAHLWLAEIQTSGCMFFLRIHDFCPISKYGKFNPIEGSSCIIYFSKL